MSSIQVNNIKNANGTSAIAIDSSGVATFSKTLVPANPLTNRNLVINGDMRIDQRNAGASVSSNNTYAVDRLRNVFTSGGSFTAQQSTTAPDNFTNSVVWTVGSAASATASQVANMQYRLEGNTLSHLGFGTASAQTITLSFWVRSSVTGTYCAAFINSAADRAYVAEYTISSANTWEQKSITLTGDTSGTWLTTNGIGLRVQFDLGSGSDYNATANTWVGANDFRTTNQTDFINNAGATFYLTGVQLEVGDAATPFEHRPYDAELARCERYYQKNYLMEDAPGVSTSGENTRYMHGSSDGSSNGAAGVFWRCRMRATPTVTWYTDGGTQGQWNYARSGASGAGTFTAYRVGDTGANGFMGVGAAWVTCSIYGNWTANAEL